jgi:hypothetical protein
MLIESIFTYHRCLFTFLQYTDLTCPEVHPSRTLAIGIRIYNAYRRSHFREIVCFINLYMAMTASQHIEFAVPTTLISLYCMALLQD